VGAYDFIPWTWLEKGVHAYFWLFVLKRSKRCVFTLRVGLVCVVLGVPIPRSPDSPTHRKPRNLTRKIRPVEMQLASIS